VFGSDHEDTTRLISPLFEKYNVDLVISGHNHHMELLEKDGVTYVLEGVAGGGVPGPRAYQVRILQMALMVTPGVT